MIDILGQKEDGLYLKFHIGLTLILLSVKILKMIGYLFFDIKLFLIDKWNYFDITMFVMFLVYPMTIAKGDNESAETLFSLVILFIMFYRGMSFLRVFDYFKSLVGMINTIIGMFTLQYHA